MEILEFNSSLMGQTLHLCTELKSHDRYPCSYWRYDEVILRDSVTREDQKMLVGASQDNQIICIGTLTKGGPYQNHWAEIGVAVHPKKRGEGFASKMVEALESLKDVLNIEFIKALILENNQSSRKLFERQGYELKATLFHDFKIEGFGNLNDCAYYKILNQVGPV